MYSLQQRNVFRLWVVVASIAGVCVALTTFDLSILLVEVRDCNNIVGNTTGDSILWIVIRVLGLNIWIWPSIYVFSDVSLVDDGQVTDQEEEDLYGEGLMRANYAKTPITLNPPDSYEEDGSSSPV